MSPQDGLDRALLATWLGSVGKLEEVSTLAGDVGLRRYYRLSLGGFGSAVLATYPQALQGSYRRFERTTDIFEGLGIRVPRILLREPRQRWMLLEDLGPRTVYDLPFRWDVLEPYYRDALAIVERIATLPREAVAGLSEPLDRSLLERELNQTLEVFLQPAGLLDGGDHRRSVELAFSKLCDALAGDEVAACHRDFMVRNLVPLAGGRVAVLDHQDLRLGPAEYDSASLLNDSFFPEFGSDLYGPRSHTAAFHRAAAQRTLKAVGTYAAFARRGNDRHLGLIPRTLERACDHLAAWPETAGFAARVRAPWAVAAAAFC
ncbi:MAG: phosphotransferase [Acidobacteriota bacterium]